MAVSVGKTEAKKMAVVLEPEYEAWTAKVKELKKAHKKSVTADSQRELDDLLQLIEEVEGFALAALEAAQDILITKAKFTVVGQVDQRDGKGEKVALGWYSTEKQAIGDALSLTYSTATHETAKAWVLPLHVGTPASWYKVRKEAQKAQDGPTEYRKREIQRREEWFREHPEEPIPLDWTIEVVTKIDTDECVACYGLGRIPKDEIKRRDALPEWLRNKPRAA